MLKGEITAMYIANIRLRSFRFYRLTVSHLGITSCIVIFVLEFEPKKIFV